jgi:hypothetical protein
MKLFKKKKPTQVEILRKEYIKEFKAMTTYTNGVRVNEDLVGRLKSYREIVLTESKFQPRVQSSTKRPVDFKDNIAAWLEAVRLEARKLVKGNVSPLRKVA